MEKINLKKSKVTICPRCKGNGYFTVKESVEHPLDKVVQCPMCESHIGHCTTLSSGFSTLSFTVK